MVFKDAIKGVAQILQNIGSSINEDEYDGIIVKKLEASNTLDKGRTTNQSHIAITGNQMDMFPYVRADGYFENDYDDKDDELKKYYVAQIPIFIHKDNIDYIDCNVNIGDDDEKKVYASIVRSRRKGSTDQIQMSITHMDSKDFVEFRRAVHTGSYIVILKRKKQLLYDIFAVREEDIEADEISLEKMNNKFYKLPINTAVHLDEIEPPHEEDKISPEWVKSHEKDFPSLDADAKKLVEQFNDTYSPEKLEELSGIELLNTIFLNKDNKSNLCYFLEFDNDCRELFGSIKSGTSYKYGLHYSKKNNSWATGSSAKPIFLQEEEAIELGTQIRDYLIAGAEIVKNAGELLKVEDFRALYNELNDITDGYVNKVWFMKYFTLVNPELFPPIYSLNAQCTVLEALGLTPMNNPLSRMGQIKNYIDKCDVSNPMFSRIFWTYWDGKEKEVQLEEQEEDIIMKSCLEIERTPRTNKEYPLNFIIYGAPGTGKTYSTVEYALGILENTTVDLEKKSFEARKEAVSRYKAYMKKGQIAFTTFHQNYGYEEFIQGLRPDKDSETMSFDIVDGVFKKISDKALNDSDDNNYVIIIDEINRANISKVFGELITLIEEDKRWGEMNETSATLQSGDIFAVPNNLYIIGTMNSADKSISLIDAALRRRFEFVESKPDASLIEDETLKKFLTELNLLLVEKLGSTDLLVGHSYFLEKKEEDLCTILNNSIIPLLYEYFYDDKKKIIGILSDTIKKSNAKVYVVDEKIGRLYVKEKEETDDSE